MLTCFKAFINFLHQPLAALRMEHFIIIIEILGNACTKQALSRLLTGDACMMFVLFYAERNKIGSIKILFAHPVFSIRVQSYEKILIYASIKVFFAKFTRRRYAYRKCLLQRRSQAYHCCSVRPAGVFSFRPVATK